MKKTIRAEEFLKQAADELKEKKPQMSLRAVAAKIGISPSYWSKVLRGLKPVPEHLIPKIAKALYLDQQQIALLQRAILETIESDRITPQTGIRTSGEAKESPIENYKNLGKEAFWILEEWYYIPILNLITLKDFSGHAEELGTKLGLRSSQIKAAVQRLETHGFVRIEGGRIIRTDEQIRFPTDRSYPLIRKYHQSMLKKAHEELAKENTAETFENRLISSVCFTGRQEKLKEARVIIEEAIYRAANLLAEDPDGDEVYQLSLQIFPLSREGR